MKHVLVLLLGVVACGVEDTDSDATTDGTPSTATTEPLAEGLAPLAEISGSCPKLSKSGSKSFTSAGVEREVLVYMPRNPEPGLPVVFFWHGLGDSASGIDRALDLEGFAKKHDVVMVIPESTDPFLLTWNVLSGGDDAVLFDDMRSCLSQELDIDLERVHTAGFSYGALFSTWLLLNRADTLASAVILSGGTDDGIGLSYRTPKAPVPTLVTWGGDADYYDAGFVQIDFQAAAIDLVTNLSADGHTVVGCDHGLGHTLPMDYADAMDPWLLEHRFGEPSPFAGGIDGFPTYCAVE